MTNKEIKMNQFESLLLEQLNTVADRRSARRPLMRKPAVLALPAGALGVAAAAIVGVGALGGASPAYAVTTPANGDVVVTINSLSDASGLQSQLHSDGIDANVSYNGASPSSTEPGAGGGRVPAYGESAGGTSQDPGSNATTYGPGFAPAPDGIAPVKVSLSQGSVTLDIPAADVRNGYTLDISTNGKVSGPAGLEFAWYKQ